MTPAIIMALLEFAIVNGGKVADLVARWKNGEEVLTDEQAQAIVAQAQAGSQAINTEWLNS